jgi:hypothetical protein
MGRAQFLKSSYDALQTAIDGISASVDLVSAATATLDSKIDLMGDGFKPMVAGDTVQATSAAVSTSNSSTATKVKDFRVLRPGGVRIKFEYTGSCGFQVAVYVNGVMYAGAYITESTDIWKSAQFDLVGLEAGDNVQIYDKYITFPEEGQSYPAVRNATLCYDLSSVDAVVVL